MNLQEQASPAADDTMLADVWRHKLSATPPTVTRLLQDALRDSGPALADHFYGGMLEDPRAAQFLSADQVRARLKPSMQRWLHELLNATETDVAALLETQRTVGAVHARIGIPVDLVTRGTRMLKTELYRGITTRAESAALARDAISTVSTLIDFALEAMSQAYAIARERAGQMDTSYRLFSLIQNVSTERERQRALLLAWENHLLYTLASHAVPTAVECTLVRSEFGLWFVHKGLASFGDTLETRQVIELMEKVDAELRERLPAAQDKDARLAMLQGIRHHVAEIRSLMTLMFEGIGDLEAGRDALTSLLNRRFLPTVLRREIQLQAKSDNDFAVLLLDLDHFKSINDNHGHEAGDRALQHVASLLTQHTRSSDYLFRYGGEEFVVVLGSVRPKQAEMIAENLRERIANTPLVLSNGLELSITASIGLALQDGHPDYERVLARADAAMYQAKRQGRNGVVLASEGLPEPPGVAALRAPAKDALPTGE